MVRCEVIEKFDLKDFDKLKNIKRVARDDYGKLYVGDTFECDEDMAKYLTGSNPLNKEVVKVIEVKAKVKEAVFEDVEQEEKPKKTIKKAKSKK